MFCQSRGGMSGRVGVRVICVKLGSVRCEGVTLGEGGREECVVTVRCGLVRW